MAARRPTALIALAATFVMALLGASNSTRAEAGTVGQDGSGGRAVAHRSGGRAVNTPAVTSQAPDARLFRIGLNAVEPTLGQTKNGDIFYTAFQSNTRIEVVRSQDEGKSWDVVSPKFGSRNAQLVSFDPYIYVDPRTNRVFTIDLTVACSYLSFSDDQGKSWITNPLACGRPVNDHQTLFAGPPAVSPTVAYESIVYYCWNDVGSSSCSKSLDGGVTFHPTGSPAFPGYDPNAGDQNSQFCGGLHGHGHVGYDGTVYVPKGHCGQPWLSISRDEGRTWTRVQVAKIGAEGHEASVAADKAGNIYYTWVSRDRMPYLVVSRDGGKKWSDPMMIGPPGLKEANLPSLDVGDPGKIAVAYMGSENSPFRPVKRDEEGECTAVNQCGGDPDYSKTTWNGYMMVSTTALDPDPIFFTGTVNDKKDPLIRDTCGPGRCRAVFDFIDIIVGRDGTAWGAWVDGCISLCATPAGGGNMGSDGVVGRLVGGPKLR
ncbi:MAG: glycoside hydrolase [Actinomycetota bacterium]|nr:glycoside hydrolase [Actinomycetota bacterium]